MEAKGPPLFNFTVAWDVYQLKDQFRIRGRETQNFRKLSLQVYVLLTLESIQWLYCNAKAEHEVHRIQKEVTNNRRLQL